MLTEWYTAPDWWLVIVAALTGAVIGWQSFATAKSAKAAFMQIRMMKDKERARVEIKPIGLTLEHEDAEFWNLKAGIELRNVGAGRAYVRQGAGTLIIGEPDHEPPSEPDYCSPLDVVDSFIDPTGDPTVEPLYFFQTDSLNLSEYSQKICDGRLQLYITGYIEYETVGARFHRDFEYSWVGHDNPLNIGARLTFMDEFKPKTDGDRVSFGYWAAPIGSWTPSRFRDNEEYEMKQMKAPQKAKKLRKKTN